MNRKKKSNKNDGARDYAAKFERLWNKHSPGEEETKKYSDSSDGDCTVKIRAEQ